MLYTGLKVAFHVEVRVDEILWSRQSLAKKLSHGIRDPTISF